MAQRPDDVNQQELRGGRPQSADEVDELSERDPEELRRDIAGTRQEMGDTLDEIEDRVRPSRIVERRTARMRSRMRRVRDTVMGSAGDDRDRSGHMGDRARERAGHLRDRAGDLREGAGSAVDTVEHAPEAALERARGNPLGAGLIAFGLGVVASGLLPDSRREQQMASAVAERLEPVKEQLGEAAGEVGSDVADSARGAAQRTGEHARDQAKEAGQDVRDEVSDQS